MLRQLWSCLRQIHVDVSKTHITYTIPRYSEKNILGEFEAIRSNSIGDILVVFMRKDEAIKNVVPNQNGTEKAQAPDGQAKGRKASL